MAIRKLLVSRGSERLTVFPVGPGTCKIGRSPDCDLPLFDERISRHHCDLVNDGASLRLVNRSQAGTRVDGVLSLKEVKLKTDSKIEIGSHVLELGGLEDRNYLMGQTMPNLGATEKMASKSRAGVRPLEIVGRNPDGQAYRALLPDTTFTIGSVSGNSLHIRSKRVSRWHCRIVRQGDGYYVVDQQSTNGTYLNGSKVGEAKLRSGDTLRVADVEIRVREPEEIGETRFVAQDPKMLEVLELVARVAAIDATVLITGETGTGKELVARAIHEQSPRKEKTFVEVNCGAIAESLVDSELFGHVKGAFTGATSTRKGLLEEADGGTLFLDEVAELSLNAQVKLLRTIQEGTIRKVGESGDRKIDARIVAATNRNLEKLIAEGKFREDLYYRINVARIELPPLRERRGDIELLAEHFLREIQRETGRECQLSAEAKVLIRAYSWPGNVRGLQVALSRACLQTKPGESIGPAELALDTSHLSREEIVKAAIKYPSVRTAAEALGLPKTNLHRWIRELGHCASSEP